MAGNKRLDLLRGPVARGVVDHAVVYMHEGDGG